MRPSHRAVCFLFLLVPSAVDAVRTRSLGSEADDSTAAVVSAAAAYVAEYQRQLTSVIADEIYAQTLVRQVPADDTPRTRRMEGEVFFMFAPGTRMWMAIRDVIAVDGSAVADRPEIRTALSTRPASEVAASFKTYNSRFNLGRTIRNFNEPTLSLLPLDSMHRARFSFKKTATERNGNDMLVTIAFTEKDTPTLIRDVKHGRVFSKGELLIHAATGRIQRATFAANTSDVRVRLATTYAPDERLGMWVPALFREEYEHGDARSRESELVVCEASYRNYRRFETSVRVK